MLSGIGFASFAESTVVPIPLETLLIPLMQARRDKLWLIALVTTLGCIAGAIFGYFIGYFVFDLARDWVMQYITTEEQFSAFEEMIAQDGFWFVFSTGVTPIPLQIAMLVAGVTKYSFALYLLAVILSRTIRYFGLALLVYYFGNKTEKLVRRYKWRVAIVGIIVVTLIIAYRIYTNI